MTRADITSDRSSALICGVESLAVLLLLAAAGSISCRAENQEQPAEAVAATQSSEAAQGQKPTPERSRAPTVGLDWPMFRGNRQLTGVAQGTLPQKLDLLWKSEAPSAIASTAAIVGDTVYVADLDGVLWAIDFDSGKVKWKYEVQNEAPIESSPTVVDGVIYIGDDDGVLHAVDAATGKAKWTFRHEYQAEIIASVNYEDGILLVGAYSGLLLGVDATSGKMLWEFDTEGQNLHATPSIAEGKVMVAGCDEHLSVVNIADGKLVRKVPLESVSVSSPAIVGDLAFLGTYGAQVRCLNWKSGETLWVFEDPELEFPIYSSAAAGEKAVFIGGRDKRLRALDIETGEQLWEFAAKARIDSSPVVVGDRVFVGSNDGNLYELEAATGKERWRFEAGAAITASPAIAAQRLVIGSDDGVLYCFGEKKK